MNDVETNRQSPPTQGPNFSPPDPYTRSLFLGPDGLRPGWGLAFYLVIFYPLQVEASEIYLPNVRASDLWSELLVEFALFVSAVLPALLLARIEQRRWGVYGLPVKQAFRGRFWIGAVWGIGSVSLLLLALRGVGAFDFGSLALHGARIARFAAFWAVFFLCVGLFEEFLLRGYMQFTLARGIGFWPAAIILSAAFGLIHLRNDNEHWPGLLAAAWIGFFFCFTLRRMGNLWFAVGFHAAWDWGETFFYSVPDSGIIAPGHLLKSSLHGPVWLTGGVIGPEGSLLCFVVIAVTWIAFGSVYRRPVAAKNQVASSL
jgi:uncharacterized protein